MFHVQQAHSPTKHMHSRSAAGLRSTSPRKKQHQHAHRLGDGDMGPQAGPSDSIVPVKPTQRSNLKPTLGKSLDPSAAKALFGGQPKAGPSAGPSKAISKKIITTPPANGASRGSELPPLMTSPRKALGDKTNASPTKNVVELPEPASTWNPTELGELSLQAESSVEPPALKGILTSSALTDAELDEICGEINSGDFARALPMDRPDAFADLPPSADTFKAASRNLQAVFSNHFAATPQAPISYEHPPCWNMGTEEPTARPTQPKPSSRPITSSTTSRPPRTTTAPASKVRTHARVPSSSSTSTSTTASRARSVATTTATAAVASTRRTATTKPRP
ncbi:hypothetical protein CF326_g5053 [Tilletia indica]|nr:hypothetical protein CF326_g5053 [Tilletia indica]